MLYLIEYSLPPRRSTRFTITDTRWREVEAESETEAVEKLKREVKKAVVVKVETQAEGVT